MKIYILIGNRPNFIKVTQFKKCANELDPDIKITIIHTGQHYDEKMADVFFRQFNLLPDHYLNISPAWFRAMLILPWPAHCLQIKVELN